MKKPPIRCRDVVRKVCADLGRDLDAPECRPVLAHIRSCPKCSAWKDSMEKTVGLFRSYPSPSHTPLRSLSAGRATRKPASRKRPSKG